MKTRFDIVLMEKRTEIFSKPWVKKGIPLLLLNLEASPGDQDQPKKILKFAS